MKFFTINYNERNMGNGLIAWHAGLIGGMTQWANNMKLPLGTISTLMEGALTAVICGFGGLLGKELFALIKKSIIAYKKNRAKQKAIKNNQI